MEKEHNVEESGEGSAYEAVCWGCSVQLRLPSVVSLFRCGWCGAITSQGLLPQNEGCCLRWATFWNRTFIAFVIALISLIIGGAWWAARPVLYPTLSPGVWVHLGMTIFLGFNTIFNYCLAAFMPAGPVPPMLWGRFEVVSKGCLDGYRFCHFCKKPKPPGSHHCRSCKQCVLKMDHHCPFIGNCVGASNRRPFILFLFFAVMSNVYVMAVTISAGIRLLPSFGRKSRSIGGYADDLFQGVVRAVFGHSVYISLRSVALMYLTVASISIVACVGVLLFQQLQLVFSGQTYIDSLQSEAFASSDYRKGWKNLQKEFGSVNPIAWFFPRMTNPSTNGKKVNIFG